MLNQEFFEENQAVILRLANSPVGNWLFGFSKFGHSLRKQKIARITPFSVAHIERVMPNGMVEVTEQFFSRPEYAMTLEAALAYVPYLLDDWLAPSAQAVLALRMSILTVNPVSGANSPCDGRCYQNDKTTWSTAHDAASSTGADATQLDDLICRADSQSAGGNLFSISRTWFNFDTSALTSLATVSSAVFSFFGTSTTFLDTDSDSIRIVSSSLASTADVTASDYQNLGTTGYAPDFDVTLWNQSGYNDFTFNSTGIAAVSLTGITKIAVRTMKDAANTSPSGRTYVGGFFADNGSNKPKLVVTYTIPSQLFFQARTHQAVQRASHY